MLKIADELKIVENFLYRMPKVYRKRHANHTVVRHILMAGTSTAGMTSCCIKCNELGIDPYGYNLEKVEGEKDV
jgi:hypothetical protein